MLLPLHGQNGPGTPVTTATNGTGVVGASVGQKGSATTMHGVKAAELVSSRELMINLTLRELRGKYKRSVLGWT